MITILLNPNNLNQISEAYQKIKSNLN